ncbi:N-acetylmuramoyl-L-alanine amidase family protein [Lacrimispora celerecrescens]|uniref:Putative cell wall binding repeat protein n=1 Tax=[Clostridium] celerecrescens 18A TaxID=1286362 RepID=A0A2M8Z8U9_9FIRM|nr:cell wall-binding protein [Lacrimispora celerecrescens]PJJ29878.1 putative cell wall binding repeat protein [[Clostridium] celerecrescens 18A]
MKMKKLMVAALAAAITVGSALPASAAWVQSGSEWRYQNQDGSWQANKWFQEDGKWYHFDANGNAQKGWLKDTDGKWYFFAYNGIMQTGLIKVDDKVYYMNADGSLFSGDMKIGTVEYNFTEYGTTNGKPSVGSSQTFGGNGNQAKFGGGGGHSSSRTSNTTTPPKDAQTAAKDAVANAFENAAKSGVDVKGTTITFTLADLDPELNADSLISDVQGALNDILNGEDVTKVKVGTREFTKDNAGEFESYAQNYAGETVEDALAILKNMGIRVYAANDNDGMKYTLDIK